MLKLELDELFTPALLEAFRKRWGVSPDDADRIALRTVKLFEVQTGVDDKSASRRRKDAWLKLMLSALIGPEPDFLGWIEALATGNFELRKGSYYSKASGTGQPSLFLKRQREHIEKLVSKDRLSPAEREDRRRAYLDALRQILVTVLLRELKAACNARITVGPAWSLIRASEHLADEDLGLLRHFGGESGFDVHLSESMKDALTTWVDEHHDGSAPIHNKNYYQKGLPSGVTRLDALRHLDRETVAIDDYRAELSRALELDPPLLARATSGANLHEIADEDADALRSAFVTCEPGPYRHFTEANGGDERFDYHEECRANLRAYMPILTSSGTAEQRAEAARRARQRADLRVTRPGKMLDHDLQDEIASFVLEELPPPTGLTPEHAIYFEEEVCRYYDVEICTDRRWKEIGLTYPDWLPF